MEALLYTTGITGLLLGLTLFGLWKLNGSHQKLKAETEVKVQSLEKHIEAKNEEIKILSDRTPVDVKQLLRDGDF
jgi:hypothetical protein